MTPEKHSFSVEEQAAFDRVFQPEEIRDFEEAGFSDWVGIFEALTAFDFNIQQEGHQAVIEMFLSHRYAPQIIRRETEEGLMIYRRNITPLLKASLDVFWESSNYWNTETKQRFNQIFSNSPSPVSNAERDWQK